MLSLNELEDTQLAARGVFPLTYDLESSRCSPVLTTIFFQTYPACPAFRFPPCMSSTPLRSRMQVMYAYVMRPETLPHSYWKFIVKSGPVSAVVLEAVRRNNRGLPVDADAVNRSVYWRRCRVRI